MPHNKNKKPTVVPVKPTPPPSPPVKKSDPTTVYLISGIGALIFVVLVGLCLCKKNQKAQHSHRRIDGSDNDGE